MPRRNAQNGKTQTLIKSSKRRHEIDTLRGIAVIVMIIFHFGFILNFLDITQVNHNQGFWLYLARTVQLTFTTLVGISLALSNQNSTSKKQFYKKQSTRGVLILVAATVVTMTTKIITPHAHVKFGILHFIGISILVLLPFAQKKVIPLILAITALAITPLIQTSTTTFSLLYPLGFQLIPVQATLDYFPLFPWISLPLIGISIGNIIYQQEKPIIKRKFPRIPVVNYIGSKALVIYLIHIPAIYLSLQLYKSI